MREFQEKKPFRRLLFSRAAAVILLILIFFAGRAAWNVYTKEKESAANALNAQAELEKLKARQNVLSSELNKLGTDEGVEEEIRAKYSVSKPGENVVIIVDSNASDTATTTAPVPESGWTKFKKFFR